MFPAGRLMAVSEVSPCFRTGHLGVDRRRTELAEATTSFAKASENCFAISILRSGCTATAEDGHPRAPARGILAKAS